VTLGIGWWLGHGAAQSPPPAYKQITFRTGSIGNARFAPDGSFVYSASWEGGDKQLYLTRENDPSARELGLKDAELLSVSRNGELAVRLHSVSNSLIQLGTLARVPLSGGTPRQVLDNVMDADWAADGDTMAVARYLPENGHWHLEYPIGKVLLDSVNWINSPRISPDGKWIAFVDHENSVGDDEGAIAVIATDGKGQEKKLSPGWESIEGLIWSRSGDEVWFTATTVGFATNAHAVNLSGKVRSITNVPGGMWLQDLRNGVVLAVTNQGGRGIRALAPGENTERDLGWFGWSVYAGLSRDGRKVLFFEVGEAAGPNYSVFLRDTDGSPPASLGEGRAVSISPDSKWVITQPSKGGSLSLVPTGAGESRVLTHDAVGYGDVGWLPDGKRLVATGIEAGHGKRDYLIEVSNGDSKPLTPEGIVGVNLSPDGRNAAVIGPDGKWGVWPLEGGIRLIPGLDAKYTVIGWTTDGGSVYVVPAGSGTRIARIFKVNVTSGKVDPWKTLGADSGPGYWVATTPSITNDGSAYAYGYGHITSQAYVVTGLK
jgi:Tol biopolymer transport system component